MKKMLLIDGNSLLFRAFYATSYGSIMKTSFGEYTNAVFTFITMLNKAIKQIEPEYIAVAFDKGKKTFRHEKLESYKEGRKETPEELVGQFKLVRDMLSAYGIPYLEFDYIEADDIVGTLAKKYTDIHCFILSSDKDLLQLVDDSTTYLMMKKGMSDLLEITPSNIVEQFGVTANQIPDLKGLMGDSSDNIKGVDGVGEKTALKFLNEYQTIEHLYENIDLIKGKIKEKLIIGKENAFLSKEIATIKTDVVIENDLDFFELNIHQDEFAEFLKKYEMNSLLKQIPIKENVEQELIAIEHVRQFSKKLLHDGASLYFYFEDFEYYDHKLLAIGLMHQGVYQLVEGDGAMYDQDFCNFLASSNRKISSNVKRLYHLQDIYNVQMQNIEDVELMGYLSNNNLDDLNKLFREFDLELIDQSELVGSVKKPKQISNQLLDRQMYYLLKQLHIVYTNLITILKRDELDVLYRNLELPLAHVLYRMEHNGICVDETKLDSISNDLSVRIHQLTEIIHQLAGEQFNINSPKQLAEILFDKLKLPSNKKRSTSIEVLEYLEPNHPIITAIIDYRKYTKIYSTYSEGLKKYVKKDGKIHTIYSALIAQTGRLSSKDPNLQNLSVRTSEGKEVRKAFVASYGHVLISSDYSQIELRIMAHMAKEQNMIAAFRNGIDIHTKTAMDMFDITVEEVNGDYRRKAKAINFGIIYGISEFGLMKQVGINMFEAKDFIDTYFRKYPAIKLFMDSNVEHLKEKGYVKTMFNRRRYIDEIHSDNYQVREFAKRAAFNSPIQGTGADIIKIAMIRIQSEIDRLKLKSKLILQIHDELVFDVLESEIEKMKEIIQKGMTGAVTLSLPLESDMHISTSLFVDK